MPDAHKNFAYSTIVTAPSPATTGTSTTVASGGGALFPTAPFNAVVWPAGAQPLASNAEVVRVTAIAGDVLTITRAQESSTARTIIVGDQIAAAITAKVISDADAVGGVTFTPATGAGQIPVTSDATHGAFQAAAVRSTGTPNVDTQTGAAGNSGTYADGAHSHAFSALYPARAKDDLNVVTVSGTAQTLPDPAILYETSFIKLTNNCLFTFPAAAVGKYFDLFLQQDGTGSRVPSFPVNIAWIGGTQPTWSTAANRVDHIRFKCFDSINWMAEVVALGLVIPTPPITVVQQVTMGGANGDVQMTLAANPTAGNTLLLVLGVYDGAGLPANPSGGGVTWQQIGKLSTPTAPTVTQVGTAGAASYSYKITYVNAWGETVASTATNTTTGNATLTGVNKNRVAWSGAPTDAVSVKVYGRTGGTYGLLSTTAVGTGQWDDDGSATPGATAPTYNNTADSNNVGGAGASLNSNSAPKTFEAWIGVGASGGGGTSTISFNQSFSGQLFELKAGVLEASVPPQTKTGSSSSGFPWTTPSITAPRDGDAVFIILIIPASGDIITPGLWTKVIPYDSREFGYKDDIIILYQLSTTNGASYSATAEGAGGTPNYIGVLSFFIRQ